MGGIGVLLPAVRELSLLLGGTGIFIGMVSYLVMMDRAVPLAVAEGVYRAKTHNVETLMEELGGERAYVYVPEMEADGEAGILLSFPAGDCVESVSNIRLQPTGLVLYKEFESALGGEASSDPDILVEQLVDGLLNQFEIVQTVILEDVFSDGVTIGVKESLFGPETAFDHPVISFFGVGIANGLGHAVLVTDIEASDEFYDFLVTYKWPTDGDSA